MKRSAKCLVLFISVALAFQFLTITPRAGDNEDWVDIPISVDDFPDEHFREYIFSKIDKDKSGFISETIHYPV